METYDWSRFTVKINIDASVSEVYNAWTIQDKLEEWFLRSAEFKMENGQYRGRFVNIHTSDTYEWLWHGYPDTVVEKGKVILSNGMDKLKFSFSGGALVTVDIGEINGQAIVMLTQEHIPTDEYGKVHYHMGCKTGWTFYLANLKSYLEGGTDLRNKHQEFVNMVNA